jgi:hypothetical protein
MKLKYYSDNAKPCWGCNGTIAEYETDNKVRLVGVRCTSCGRRDVFSARIVPTTAEECSAAHRAVP